jgi:selenocysteine lyase/cysteine desulfurase
LETLPAYKVRPASNQIPDKWMQGTQNHEGIAGAAACVDYLQRLGATLASVDLENRRECLRAAFAAIEAYETQLTDQFLAGVAALGDYELVGIDWEKFQQDPYRHRRVSTFSVRHRRVPARQLATQLAAQGLYCWDGNYYALELSEQLGYEPEGMLRIGLVHYNTAAEVDRLLAALQQIH